MRGLISCLLFLVLCLGPAAPWGVRLTRLQMVTEAPLDVAVRLNQDIVKTFSSQVSSDDLERLRATLRDSRGDLNQVNVITLMHRCHKFKTPLFSILEPQTVLTLLESSQATSQGLANAIYSLQSLDLEHSAPEARSIVGALSRQLRLSTELFDGQALSNAFYGLGKLGSGDPDAEELLAALAATTMLLALAAATMLTVLAAYQSSERALYAVRTTRSNAGNTIRGLTESALQRVLGSGNQAKRNTHDHIRSILDNALGRVD